MLREYSVWVVGYAPRFEVLSLTWFGHSAQPVDKFQQPWAYEQVGATSNKSQRAHLHMLLPTMHYFPLLKACGAHPLGTTSLNSGQKTCTGETNAVEPVDSKRRIFSGTHELICEQ